MQIVAVPLYSKTMEVAAYMFRHFTENVLFSSAQAINLFDGAAQSDTLEVLDKMGLEAFTLGKPLFIPIKEVLLLNNPNLQCSVDPEKIIFTIEEPISHEEIYIPKVELLRGMGYRFAANYKIDFTKRDKFLDLCSFAFFSQRPERAEEADTMLKHVKSFYRNVSPIAAHVYTDEVLKSVSGKGYEMFESRFYRITKAGKELAPMKFNALRLINTVQDDNFDFGDITAIVKSDPILTISLLRMVNSTVGFKGNKVGSIPQAVALLGQREVRKWVTTAVSQTLGDDRPNEVTRISLIRAKFCENLAPLFEMAHMSNDLFLLGLFSVLDVILELPMPEALNQIFVSDNIRKALLDQAGILHPVIKFVAEYEIAYWSAISRKMIVHNIKDEDLSEAYLSTLEWYKDLITVDDEDTGAAGATGAYGVTGASGSSGTSRTSGTSGVTGAT